MEPKQATVDLLREKPAGGRQTIYNRVQVSHRGDRDSDVWGFRECPSSTDLEPFIVLIVHRHLISQRDTRMY